MADQVNDIQAYVQGLSDGWAQERSKTQMTIEKAQQLLRTFPEDKPLEQPLDLPTSYRGYYRDLSFGAGNRINTVGDLLQALHAADGNIYEGWKGGEFLMGPETPLWFATEGSCGDKILAFVNGGPNVTMTLGEDD